jgi:hypothetical protein
VPQYACPETGTLVADHYVIVYWYPRVHKATTGDIDFTGDTTLIANVSPDPTFNTIWQVGDRIMGRTSGGAERITAGTYVKAVTSTTITLSKAAAGGSGTETLNLYGATVYSLDRTQVP